MRCLVEVIDQITAVEPLLADRLKSVRDSSLFAAPECQARLWRLAANLLADCGSDRVAAIFMGDEQAVDEESAMFLSKALFRNRTYGVVWNSMANTIAFSLSDFNRNELPFPGEAIEVCGEFVGQIESIKVCGNIVGVALVPDDSLASGSRQGNDQVSESF